jgi:hypothetical protein
MKLSFARYKLLDDREVSGECGAITNCPWVNYSRRKQNKKEGVSGVKFYPKPKRLRALIYPLLLSHSARAHANTYLSILDIVFGGLCEDKAPISHVSFASDWHLKEFFRIWEYLADGDP